MADINAHVVELDGDIVGGLARELQRVGAGTAGVPSARWSVDRLPELTRGWYNLSAE